MNKNEHSNIPISIEKKLNKNLHNKLNHPIEIIKKKIYKYFDNFEQFDNFSPQVSTRDNFDKLLIEPNHPARSKSDTYYVNENTVLRTHTSAHQNELLNKGHRNFLVTGDVYRKDEINATHYPVFHQMEGVGEIGSEYEPITFLTDLLEHFVKYLFPNVEFRIKDDYFPFTEPSFEVEILHNGNWLEILGCGIVHKTIRENNNIEGNMWAFGLGLERLCMIYFDIPDIRYFWTEDEKFLKQFESGEIVKFKPYSTLENISRDISFWIPEVDLVRDQEDKNKIVGWNELNDFYELVRNICGDMVGEVLLKDEFFNNKTNKYSRMYRIVYNADSMSTISNPSEMKKTVDGYHNKIGVEVGILGVEVR